MNENYDKPDQWGNHVDENTGEYVDSSGHIARIHRPPLAELRESQLMAYGRWTAGRQS